MYVFSSSSSRPQEWEQITESCDSCPAVVGGAATFADAEGGSDLPIMTSGVADACVSKQLGLIVVDKRAPNDEASALTHLERPRVVRPDVCV